MQRTALVLLASLLLSAPVLAQGPIAVKGAWARATAPGQPVAGAFMELVSTRHARLVGAASPVAQTVEVHSMRMKDGVMEMRAIPALDLPAGKPVILKPGAYHIMLIDLKQQLKPGDSVPLTLTVEDAKTKKRTAVAVTAEVREMPGGGNMHGH